MKALIFFSIFHSSVLSFEVEYLSEPQKCDVYAALEDQIQANTTIKLKTGEVLLSALENVQLGSPGAGPLLTQIVQGNCQGAKMRALIYSSEEYDEMVKCVSFHFAVS